MRKFDVFHSTDQLANITSLHFSRKAIVELDFTSRIKHDTQIYTQIKIQWHNYKLVLGTVGNFPKEKKYTCTQ